MVLCNTKNTGQKFTVVGCGLVGVVLAIELKRRIPGCTVTLIEKRTETDATGGSWTIGLTGPGQEALSDNPALLKQIQESGQTSFTLQQNIYCNGRLVNKKIKSLAKHKDSNIGAPCIIAFDRGTTLKVCLAHLREQYPNVNIFFGHKVIDVDEEGSKCLVEPPLPIPINEFDILFGADGAMSFVRQNYCIEAQVHPFPQSILILRLISKASETPDLAPDDGMLLFMSSKALPGLGATTKTKYSPSAKRFSNLAILFTQPFPGEDRDTLLTEVLIQRDYINQSRSFYPETQQELEETLKQLGVPTSVCEKLVLTENSRERVLYTVKATKYYNSSGNVAIIGNSAHATYPSLSGGFNTGLEDVTCIIDCICKHNCFTKRALMEYSEQRAPVGNTLVNISSLLAYTPSFLVSSAGTRDILRFVC